MNGVPKTHLFGVTAWENGVLLAGDATLLLSNDGGDTWSPVQAEPTIQYGWFYRVGKRGKEGYIAVGQAGWIYRADAGAKNWKLAIKK